MQESATGDECLQMWARLQQFNERRSRLRHLLEVIEEEQQVFVLQVYFQLFERRLVCLFRQSKCLSNGRHNEVGVAEGSKRDETDAIGKVLTQFMCHLQTQARFTNASCTRKCKQAHRSEEGRVGKEGRSRCSPYH